MMSIISPTSADPKKDTQLGKSLFFFLWGLLVLVAAILLFLATTWGTGLTADSISYINGAKTIIATKGMSQLGSHWPPLYFLFLAFSFLFSSDISSAIRLLHIGIYGSTIFLVGFITYRQTSSSHLFTLLALLLAIFSMPLFVVFTMTWSEPQFFFFSLFGFYWLNRYLTKQTYSNLCFAALLISLAFFTRYIGVTLVITGCLIILTTNNNSWKKRIANTFLFGGLSSLPIFIWVSINLLHSGKAISRSVTFHPITQGNIDTGISTLQQWFFLQSLSPYLIVFPFILIAVIHFLCRKKIAAEEKNINFIDISLLFLAVYSSFLLISISFFDAHTPLSNRILSPLYLFFIITATPIMHNAFRFKLLAGKLSFIFPAFIIFLSLLNLPRFNNYVENLITNGQGFNSKEWHLSKTIANLKKLPPHYKIYSNGPEPILLHTGRNAKMLPRILDPTNKVVNQEFGEEMQQLAYKVTNNNAIIVHFSGLTRIRYYLPSLDQIVKGLDHGTGILGDDGIIFTSKLLTTSNKE